MSSNDQEIGGGGTYEGLDPREYVTASGGIRVFALVTTFISGYVMVVSDGIIRVLMAYLGWIMQSIERSAAAITSLYTLAFDTNREIWSAAWMEAALATQDFGLFGFMAGILVLIAFVYAVENLGRSLLGGG